MTLSPMSLIVLLASASSVAAQDIPTIRADGPAVWENPRLVEEMRFGTLNGPDEYVFGSVSYVAAGLDGSIFVADGQGPRLRLYNSGGEFVRNVGRAGGGPGEYQGILGMGIMPDGQLALYDMLSQRISFFDAKGEFDRSIRVNSGGSWINPGFRVETNGDLLVVAIRYETRTDAQGRTLIVEGAEPPRQLYLRVSPTGDLLDSLVVPTQRGPRESSFTMVADEGYLSPFTNNLVHAISPMGNLWSGYPREYSITLLDRAADPVSRLLRDYEPVRLRREEKAIWQLRADLITRGISAGVQIPDTKPAFRGIEVDEDGRLWVNRYVEAEERPPDPSRPEDFPPEIIWSEPPTFDVFEPSGRFLGSVTTPWSTRVLFRRGEHQWGVYRGEFDEQYVVRLRLATGEG